MFWERGCKRKVRRKICIVLMLEKTLESPLDCKEVQPVHPKGDQSWVFIGRTDAKAETPILWPPHARSWLIGKTLMLGGIGGRRRRGQRGWDGWMASPTQWTWVWASFRRWWRTGKPGGLQSMGSQRVGHNWEAEQQQILGKNARGILIIYTNWNGTEADQMQKPFWKCGSLIQ